MGLQQLGDLPDPDELGHIVASWAPDARDKAMKLFRERTEGVRKIWYCTPERDAAGKVVVIPYVDGDGNTRYRGVHGRWCDGEPHEGYPYRHARAAQWPPIGVDWLVWLMKSGRGAGKTRSGAEWVRAISSKVPTIALVGRRGVDVRATMIENEFSGLAHVCDLAGIGYTWEPSKKEFTFANGCKAFGYSAEEPDSLRGREHGAAWLDEPCHMPLIEDVWSNLEFTLRVEGMPGGAKILCTSTPLPLPWLKKLMKDSATVTVTESTYANLNNMDPGMKRRILNKYEGTRKGRQELMGEVLEDVEGALWNDGIIQREPDSIMEAGDFEKIVVAIDPAGTANRRSDLTGIVVVGIRMGLCYILDDLSWNRDDPNGKYSPQGWAKAAIKAFVDWGAADIIAEKNYGGDMVKQTIQSQADLMGELVHITVRTAMKSKQLRAEPVVALYEQGKVWHLGRKLAYLEDEMLTWVPGTGDSPNRVDALVWGVSELMKPNHGLAIGSAVGRKIPGVGGGGSMRMPRGPRIGIPMGRR